MNNDQIRISVSNLGALWDLDEAPSEINNCEDCGKLHNLITMLCNLQE